MNTELYDVGFWAGTESSLTTYLAALKQAAASDQPAARLTDAEVYDNTGEGPHKPPRLFSKQGDVGVISISGALNNSDSWMNEWLGFSGYPEIREALIHAAQQPDIKAIVLDIKSGGGAVSGVSDTGDLIATINAELKPIYSYSDGMIASAAYWLGASAKTLTIGKVTEAGSIGVLVMQQEMSKMFAGMGVTVNVIRSGKWKALGNSAEPLSDLGRETLQAQVDTLNDMFVAHVAQVRGTTSALVEQNMGQGRVFIGQAAVDVGLVDAVSNFDTFMSDIQSSIDNPKGRGIDFKNPQAKYGANLPKGSNLMKTALTAQQIAALAAGAVAPDATGDAAPALALEVVNTTIGTVAEVVATPAAEIAPAAADAGVVQLLQAQLAASQATVLQLTVEASATKVAVFAAEANLTTAKHVADQMRPVVQASLGNMRVALKGSRAGVETLNDEALIAEHTSMATEFGQKFKAGGVAAAPSSGPATDDQPVDQKHRARILATTSQTHKK